MRRTLHISAVGTSLLSNAEATSSEEVRKRGFEGWGKYRADHEKQGELLSRAKRGDELFEFILDFIKRKGKDASAELNTLLDPNYVKKEDEIRLYPTYTGNSSFAAQALYEYLRSQGYTVHDPSQTRLAKPEAGFEDEFEQTLFSLIDKVGGDITHYSEKGWRVYIHASAGLKAETTFIVIIGSLLGADLILYRHESFQRVVALPALKLRIDTTLLNELEKFGQYVPKSVADQWMLTPYDLSELKDLGYIKETPSGYILREWIKKYLEKMKSGF